MAGGEGNTEDLKLVKKGKAKQPAAQGHDVSDSPGSSSTKSLSALAELTPGSSSSLRKSLLPIAELTPGRSSLRNSLVPIAELIPGETIPNWEIRGLVVRKSAKMAYKESTFDYYAPYFSFEMRDVAGGEIRVVCFKSEVSRFFGKVVEGKELVLSRGKLIKPKEQYNRMNRRCEIVLEYDSEIRLLEEEGHDEENNKSLMERVREIHTALEFCTSKLQELETEIKKAGKIGNPAAAAGTTTSIVKMEAPRGGVVGVSAEIRAQGEKKIESSGIRKASSSGSNNTNLRREVLDLEPLRLDFRQWSFAQQGEEARDYVRCCKHVCQ